MPNPVTRVPLYIYRYGTYTKRFNVVDVNGDPVDITGYTAKLEIRLGAGLAVLHTATTVNDQLTVQSTYVDAELPAADIGAWEFSEAEYDLFIIDPSSKPFPISRGPIVVYPNITVPI